MGEEVTRDTDHLHRRREGWSGMRHGIQVRFAQRRCERCGGARLETQACPECGKKPDPREADPEVQRRQRIAVRVAAALGRTPVAPIDVRPLDELIAASREALERFLLQLRGLSRSGEDTRSLEETAETVQRLRSSAALPRPRPLRRAGRLVASVLDGLHGCLENFLAAFAAPNLGTAQRLSDRAQEHLDRAVTGLHHVDAVVERVARLTHADADDFLLLAANLALEDFEGEEGTEASLFALDAYGTSRAASIIGGEETPVPGLGLTVLWALVPAEAILDIDRYHEISRASYRLFRKHERLRSLAATPEWVAKNAAVQRGLFDNIHAMQALLAAARNDLSSARAVLLFEQDLLEGLGRHLIATLLAVYKGRDYHRLVRRDSGDLLKQARQVLPKDLLSGLSEAMRNASAHLDFRVDGESVVLCPGPGETRANAEVFGDLALMAAETVYAVNLALTCALMQAGLDSGVGFDLTEFGIAPAASQEALLVAHGWDNPRVLHDGGMLIASGGTALRSPMSIVGSLLPFTPQEVQTVVLETQQDSKRDRFSIGLHALRRRQQRRLAGDPDELTLELDFLEACASAVINGSSFISRDALRHYIAIRVGERINGDLNTALARLRQLRQFAIAIDDHHCAEVLRMVVRAVRLNAQEVPHDAPVRAALNEIIRWEQTSCPEPFAMS